MSETPPSSQPATTAAPELPPVVPPGEVDRSCRRAVLLMIVCAGLWLLAGSALGMIATLKFHSPKLLADCAWFTYGRVHPAALNAFIYGFAVQAGLAVVLWMMARLGRTRLVYAPLVIIGTLLWNAGLKVGILGIMYGETTGYDWLELPRYAAAMLFGAYFLIGIGLMLTCQARRVRGLYISQWYMLAAALWFPWIYATANYLLLVHPVRGALQVAIDSWYSNNLATVWMGWVGLAVVFYFVPKLSKQPLHSHYTGIFIFWTLGLFGSAGVIAPGSPLPSWMAALSTGAAVMTVVPVLAAVYNVHKTMDYAKLKESVSLKFILFGMIAYLLATLGNALVSLEKVGLVLHFTWFMPALSQCFLYGFFAMTLFGAMYEIVPRLVGAPLSPKLVTLHFWLLAAPGIVLYVVPLALGGMAQGDAMNMHTTAMLDVLHGTLIYLRGSTTGDLLMALGHLVFVLNLLGLLVRVGCPAVSALWAMNTRPAEVAS